MGAAPAGRDPGRHPATVRDGQGPAGAASRTVLRLREAGPTRTTLPPALAHAPPPGPQLARHLPTGHLPIGWGSPGSPARRAPSAGRTGDAPRPRRASRILTRWQATGPTLLAPTLLAPRTRQQALQHAWHLPVHNAWHLPTGPVGQHAWHPGQALQHAWHLPVHNAWHLPIGPVGQHAWHPGRALQHAWHPAGERGATGILPGRPGAGPRRHRAPDLGRAPIGRAPIGRAPESARTAAIPEPLAPRPLAPRHLAPRLRAPEPLAPLSPTVAAARPPAPSPSPAARSGGNPEEGRELTPFEEKRVTRLVKKEVASTLAETSPLEFLSRASMNRLAEAVSATLGRRLLAEKERRGLGSFR